MPKLDIYHDSFFLGTDLKKARKALKLTPGEFAAKCIGRNGKQLWNATRQIQLEQPGIKHYLGKEERRAFAKIGIEFIEI